MDQKAPSFGAAFLLALSEIMWWAHQDSNLEPDRYERSALTIELWAPEAVII